MLLVEFAELAEADSTAAAYLSACLRDDHDPVDVVPPGFVLQKSGREWLKKVSELNSDESVALSKAIPRAAMESPSSVAASRDLDATNESEPASIARRFLTLQVLPINDLALLAAYASLAQTGNNSFRTTDVTAIFRQHDCDVSNVSGTLKSMTFDAQKTPAKLAKSEDGSFRLTEAGQHHVKSILKHHGHYKGEKI